MSDDRKTSEQRHLVCSYVLGGDNDSSDHHRATIGHKNFRLFRLRVQCRDALDARNTLIDLRFFDQDVHENRALGGDLGCDFQLQDRIDKLHGNRVVDGRLDGDFLTLLDDGLLIVLRDNTRLRKKFSYAFRLSGADEKIHREIRGAMEDAKTAGGCTRAKVYVEGKTATAAGATS